MRPEFDPELECDNLQDKGTVRNSSISIKSKSKIIFFSVFTKTNKELNNQIMFKSNKQFEKSKLKFKKRKNGSSQTGKGGRGVDIRTFLKPVNKPGEAKLQQPTTNHQEGGTDRQTNSPPPPQPTLSATEGLDLGPELSKTKVEQRGGKKQLKTIITPRPTDREGESGVMTWDPALNSSSSKQLLSIFALPSVPSSDQARVSESTID